MQQAQTSQHVAVPPNPYAATLTWYSLSLVALLLGPEGRCLIVAIYQAFMTGIALLAEPKLTFLDKHLQ